MRLGHINLDEREYDYLKSLRPTSWSDFKKLPNQKKEFAFSLPEIEDVDLLKKLHFFACDHNEYAIYKLLIERYSPEESNHFLFKIRFNYVFRARKIGAWENAQAMKDTMPFFLYLASLDGGQVSTQHRELHGLILPVDHPFWNTHTPPWYWEDCDQIVQISKFKYRGLPVEFDISKINEGILIRNGIEYDVRAPIDKGEHGPACVKQVHYDKTKKYRSVIDIPTETEEERKQNGLPIGCWILVIILCLIPAAVKFL